jgi:hypothetical protein
MYFGIILPSYQHSDVSNLIEDKTIIYTPANKYLLCIASEENIPISIKDDLIPVTVNTEYDEPVHAYQHYNFNIENMDNPGLNRKLMSIRSKLVYSVSEILAPTNFYFKLDNSMNDTDTRRPYIYKLHYDSIPCYILKGDNLIENFKIATSQQVGPLIISTYALNTENVPHWYSKEIFRDIIELGEFPMDNKILVEGNISKELYLFYREEFNVTENILEDIITDIRGLIVSSMKLKIFPRNTPDEFIKSRRLKLIKNNQWIIPYNVPQDVNIYSTLLQFCFNFKSLDELFWFLYWLQMCPTYSFIEQELSIYVKPESIKVCYNTKYLPDYMRVNSASRIKISGGSDEVKLSYSDGKEFSISFYDYENNRKALLIHPNIKIYENNIPENYSLDTRIKYDTNPILT